MAIRVGVTLLTGAYEAASVDDQNQPEWPPHWMRTFCSLVAVAETDAEWHALRALERLGPPEVIASGAATNSHVRAAFVPTNSLPDKPTHQVYVGRTAGATPRTWARTHPADQRFAFVWPDAVIDGDQADSLAKMAVRVPYVGRSSGAALVSFDATTPAGEHWADRPSAGLHRWRPVDSVGERSLRIAFEGATDMLREAFAAGASAWTVDRHCGYVDASLPAPSSAPEVAPAAYGDMAAFALPTGLGLSGANTVVLTSALRAAVLSRATAAVAPIHGHHDGSVAQCAFLALVDAGHEYADGHVLGLAVAMPTSMTTTDRKVVLQALYGGDGLQVLNVRRRGPIRLARAGTSRALDPDRWTEPSTTWTTVLPMVADRFTHRGESAESLVHLACRNAGLANPVAVEIDRWPMIEGAVTLQPHQVRRRDTDPRRMYFHARITFASPVAGPVVLGHMRHYGLGLCVPVRP